MSFVAAGRETTKRSGVTARVGWIGSPLSQ